MKGARVWAEAAGWAHSGRPEAVSRSDRDVQNRVNTAKNDGLKEGEEKGLKKGKAEDIVN